MSDDTRQTVISRLLGRERITGEHPIVLTSTAAAAVREAQQAVLDAETDAQTAPGDEGKAAALEAARDALKGVWAAHADDIVTLHFEGLPPDVFEDLLATHQPTAAQEEKAGGPLEWNPTTFPPALIAATCTDPAFVTASEAHEVFYGPKARFSETEAAEVFGTALLTCRGRREVADWGKGSGETAG